MSKLNDTFTEAERELLGYCNYTAAVLAINAASAATFKTTSAYSYIVDGVFKTKAALSAQAFSAGHATVPVGSVGYFVVGLDAAGAVTTAQGIGSIPDVANGVTAVGLIRVIATSVPFVPGTSALDLAGTTTAFFDLSVLPANTSNPPSATAP